MKSSKDLEEKTKWIIKKIMKINMSEDDEKNFKMCWTCEKFFPIESQYNFPYFKEKQNKTKWKVFRIGWELKKYEVIDIQQQTRKWHSESADPAKALGLSNILDRNPVVELWPIPKLSISSFMTDFSAELSQKSVF